MLSDYGVPLLVWLHDKVCQLDKYLYEWLYVLGAFDDPA
jgi:hypothetical protein